MTSRTPGVVIIFIGIIRTTGVIDTGIAEVIRRHRCALRDSHLAAERDRGILVRLLAGEERFAATKRGEDKVLRDDRAGGESPRRAARNVLGEPLEICSITPMTGFYRDGCCNTGREDAGSHTICAVMTSAFLEFSKRRGNDLSTPLPAFGFPGLKPGDRWCLCAARWQEAFEANQAPRVVLRATHEGALAHCSFADLKRFAVDLA